MARTVVESKPPLVRMTAFLGSFTVFTSSRIENHAEDIKLSTLENFVNALGKKLHLIVA
jgi:hypothetical protein